MGNLFSWGGKGGGSSAPAMPAMPQQDFGALEGMMMNFENMMMGAMGSIAQSQMAAQQTMMEMQNMQMPSMPEMPLPTRTPEVDWTEKQDQLNAKAKADYNIDQARRKGRAGTVLSSPLLDEEDATVTGSVLADKG